jgi:glucose-6-phosphate 1-dehydrogenase
MVIFGASGDLANRKLLPTLYNLAKKEYLPKDFALIGLAKQPLSQDEFRERVRASLTEFAGAPEDCEFCRWIIERLSYLSGDFQDRHTYAQLQPLLAQMNQNYRTCGNYLFYLATGPDLFGEIIRHLAECRLTNENGRHWRRVIIEKPFGSDLDSARALNLQIKNLLSERQVYRIDHYLGKETVQNILVFRFANGISNRSGTGGMSIMCRSPWPKRLEWNAAGATTTRRAHCVIWSRVTFCN